MKTIHVVCAILREGDRVFATQRGYGDYKDSWEFPGGKVEPGETPQAALRREIREALGTINEAFDRLLDSLFQDMAWDISSDISVMKTMMAQDGLTGQRIRETQVPGAGAAANPSDVLQAAGMPQGVSDGTGTETVPQSMPAQGGGDAGSAGNAGADAFESYTDGFTEGLADEEAGGIQLKFGE